MVDILYLYNIELITGLVCGGVLLVAWAWLAHAELTQDGRDLYGPRVWKP
jgi:hypothetical protein